MTVSGKRILPAVLGVIIISALISSVLPAGRAVAGQITPRKLTLQAVGAVGGSTPGGVVNHDFQFSVPSATAVQSIKFTYCTKARDTSCVAPTNMDATTATVGTLSGISGWTMGAKTANSVVITNASAVSVAGADEVQLLSVKNTTDANTAFYVDIATFTSNDATTGQIDEGWVAAATANQIQLSGTMPESLIFCTGDTINAPGGIPDCSSATNAIVDFNQLFSPTATATATSKMAASTNASGGYVITYTGPTLTSGGTNTITPMDNSGASEQSTIGISQFGMNLAVNTGSEYTNAPAVGSAITPASNGTNLRAQAITNYDTAGNFKFTTSGDSVANSASGGASGSDMQLYTVSYMVNVNGAQTAGTYTTTLTYICTPTF